MDKPLPTAQERERKPDIKPQPMYPERGAAVFVTGLIHGKVDGLDTGRRRVQIKDEDGRGMWVDLSRVRYGNPQLMQSIHRSVNPMQTQQTQQEQQATSLPPKPELMPHIFRDGEGAIVTVALNSITGNRHGLSAGDIGTMVRWNGKLGFLANKKRVTTSELNDDTIAKEALNIVFEVGGNRVNKAVRIDSVLALYVAAEQPAPDVSERPALPQTTQPDGAAVSAETDSPLLPVGTELTHRETGEIGHVIEATRGMVKLDITDKDGNPVILRSGAWAGWMQKAAAGEVATPTNPTGLIASQGAEIKLLHAEIAHLRAELATLRDPNAPAPNLSEDVVALRGALTLAVAEHDDLQASFERLSQRHSETLAKLEAAESERATQHDRNKSQDNQIQAQAGRIVELESQLEAMTRSHNQQAELLKQAAAPTFTREMEAALQSLAYLKASLQPDRYLPAESTNFAQALQAGNPVGETLELAAQEAKTTAVQTAHAFIVETGGEGV